MVTPNDDGLGYMVPGDRIEDVGERPITGAGPHAYSSMQREALDAGLSLSLLCEIFGKDKREGRNRLKDCQKKGMRGGFPVYDLKLAAPYLVDPVVDVEEFIKKLRPQDLPMALQSEFWKGQNARLKFMEDTGDLWRTARVKEVVSDAFRVFTQTVKLFTEAIERQKGLTEEQRTLLTQLCDGLLTDTGDALLKHFKDYDSSKDHEMPPDDGDGLVLKNEEPDDGLS